jgi:hypothetical protein
MGVNDAANLDRVTVRDFGREWQRFDQAAVKEEELSGLCSTNTLRSFPRTAVSTCGTSFRWACDAAWLSLGSFCPTTIYTIVDDLIRLMRARSNWPAFPHW